MVAAKVQEEGLRTTVPTRRNPRTHKDEQTFSCVTHNVNAFGSVPSQREAYFNAFKTKDLHDNQDIISLQETHVEQEDVIKEQRRYNGRWGFRTGSECQQLSFWSPADDKKAGVAILVHPYGKFMEARPTLQHKWTPHFMAVVGKMDGHEVLAICVYAPHQGGKREAFFRSLLEIQLPEVAQVLLGGDFNCTMDALWDRSWLRPATAYESPALENLLVHWGMVDALEPPSGMKQTDRREYYARTHSYRYTLPGGGEATSRLDRWYVSAPLLDWVAQVEVMRSGTAADQSPVRLHLRNPKYPIRICRPARIYPPTRIAENEVRASMKVHLQQELDYIRSDNSGGVDWVARWDELKVRVRKDALAITKHRKKAVRATYKQKLRRLLRREQRIMAEAAGEVVSVDSITEHLDAMSLTDGRGGTPLQRARYAVADCISAHISSSQQRTFRDRAHTPGKTTKTFFKRISTKFADNAIHRLEAVPGLPERSVHDKADTLADA